MAILSKHFVTIGIVQARHGVTTMKPRATAAKDLKPTTTQAKNLKPRVGSVVEEP